MLTQKFCCRMIDCSEKFQQIFFGITSLLCFAVGMPMGIIALVSSNKPRRSTVSRLMYKMILLTDLTICILMLPTCVSNFNHWSPMLFSVPFICELWSYLWGCVTRISIFLIMLLSIIRTNSLMSPLQPSRQKHIVIPIAVYITCILIQGTVPVWYKLSVQYFDRFQSCVWFLEDLFKEMMPYEQKIYYTITYLLEFVAPIIPVTVSGLMSVYKLKTSHVEGSSNEVKEHKRQATRMILALTGVYIIFNIPYCIILTLDSVGIFYEEGFSWTDDISPQHLAFLYNFIYIHTIALNSLTNTLIYVFKMKSIHKLGQWFKRKSTYSPRKTNNTFSNPPSPGKNCVKTTHTIENAV